MGDVGRGWERLGEVGRAWERLGEVGRGWERLRAEDGRGWERLVEVATDLLGWQKLRLGDVGEMFFRGKMKMI